MADVDLQKVRESRLKLASVHVFMVDADDFSNLPRPDLLANLDDPADRGHSEEIICQLVVQQEHIVPCNAAEEHLNPHLTVLQLRYGEALGNDCASLQSEPCRLLSH